MYNYYVRIKKIGVIGVLFCYLAMACTQQHLWPFLSALNLAHFCFFSFFCKPRHTISFHHLAYFGLFIGLRFSAVAVAAQNSVSHTLSSVEFVDRPFVHMNENQQCYVYWPRFEHLQFTNTQTHTHTQNIVLDALCSTTFYFTSWCIFCPIFHNVRISLCSSFF